MYYSFHGYDRGPQKHYSWHPTCIIVGILRRGRMPTIMVPLVPFLIWRGQVLNKLQSDLPGMPYVQELPTRTLTLTRDLPSLSPLTLHLVPSQELRDCCALTVTLPSLSLVHLPLLNFYISTPWCFCSVQYFKNPAPRSRLKESEPIVFWITRNSVAMAI